MEEDSQWHLDKRVPVAIIFALLMQTIGAFWWAATITERVAHLERTGIVNRELHDRVIRLEAQQIITNTLLSEIRDDIRSQNRRDRQ